MRRFPAADPLIAEYDRNLWRSRLFPVANAGTQIGAVSFRWAPALATEFELRVRKLQLTAETYTSSAELRAWCEQNRNRCYIPEWLLQKWDITVDPTFSDVA